MRQFISLSLVLCFILAFDLKAETTNVRNLDGSVTYNAELQQYTIAKWYGTEGYNLKFTVKKTADGQRDTIIINGTPDPSGFSNRTNYVAYMADPQDQDGGALYKTVTAETFTGDITSAYGKFILDGSEDYRFVWGGHEVPGDGKGDDDNTPDPDDQLQKQNAWTLDMSGANTEDLSTLRTISYVYNQETKVYTFYNLLADNAKVKFHISNASSNVNNIKFDNTTESDYSPFADYLPGADGKPAYLVAVYSHNCYGTALSTFQTKYDVNEGKGYIVVLDGDRSKIKRVVAFGIGNHGEMQVEEVANIAAFKAKAKRSKSAIAAEEDRASIYRITGAVTCIVDYVADNSWYYVQDATGTLGIYVNHSYPLGEAHSYKAGDQLTGITGYSVGTETDGYQMEVDHESFYVLDANHNANKEYTQFPAANGSAEVLPPYAVYKKSEVSKTNLHDYVLLKGFTYEAASEETGNVHPASLKDSEGNYFEISADLLSNNFTTEVTDGATGDFSGFIANNLKSFVVYQWTLSSNGIESLHTTSTLNGKFLLNGKLYLLQNGKKFNLEGGLAE